MALEGSRRRGGGSTYIARPLDYIRAPSYVVYDRSYCRTCHLWNCVRLLQTSVLRALMKMRLTALATLIVVLAAGGVSGQMDCPEFTEAAMENVIANYIETGDNPQPPILDILRLRPVCLAYSQERDRYRFVSVVVEYTCTGHANCPSGTAVEQFDSQCSSGTWRHSVLSDVDNARRENPTADISTTTREDCALCLSPATAAGLGLTTDNVAHCVGMFIMLYLHPLSL